MNHAARDRNSDRLINMYGLSARLIYSERIPKYERLSYGIMQSFSSFSSNYLFDNSARELIIKGAISPGWL